MGIFLLKVFFIKQNKILYYSNINTNYVFIMDQKELNYSGYTCETCGKIFQTKEEFENRHKKNKNKKED